LSATPTPRPSATPTPTPEPAFVGTLNGIPIDPDAPVRSALEVCPPNGLTLPEPGTFKEVARAPGPLQVDMDRLPAGVFVRPENSIPDVWLCKGKVWQVSWSFGVEAGTANVNPGGGSGVVSRTRGLEPVKQSAARSRWSEVTIAGSPGVILASPNPVDPATPGCSLTFYDAASDVTTEVAAFTGNNDFCMLVARALFE
jgi:hypothetical protein